MHLSEPCRSPEGLGPMVPRVFPNRSPMQIIPSHPAFRITFGQANLCRLRSAYSVSIPYVPHEP